MRLLKLSCLVFSVSALGLAACAGTTQPILKDAQYWQKASVSESVYQRGPKAQQMLNRDIARCVTELRELERLGAVKNAIPADVQGRILDPDQKALADWDTPERDENLYAEHSDYHDFDGCMLAKGWERTMYVPYDVATEARDSYRKAHINYAYQDRVGQRHEEITAPGYSGDFKRVNE